MAWHVDLEGVREGETNLSVVGSFSNASVVQFQAMRTMLANLWHPHRGVTIANLGEKRFLFHFLMRLILKGYWMEALDAQQSFITFSSFTGRIDVRKPLIRRKKLLLGNKGYTYARFQYEKLLVFYFLCGREFLHQKGANLRLSMWGCVNTDTGDMENVDPNRAVGEDDFLMEIGKGKKCQCSYQFSSIFSDMDLGKTTDRHPYVHESDILAGSARQGYRMQ
ncbi:hypothetical protein Goarm_004865 [Gossypium armourianum]|uniref:DUF4283 domain-containing protein n=1 Tax=Gossypium armourianum TaxID=34283 RepID=A0A7J9JYB1_9ROSI|nr:hypothetical protein [Gossypium armourianum]